MQNDNIKNAGAKLCDFTNLSSQQTSLNFNGDANINPFALPLNFLPQNLNFNGDANINPFVLPLNFLPQNLDFNTNANIDPLSLRSNAFQLESTLNRNNRGVDSGAVSVFQQPITKHSNSNSIFSFKVVQNEDVNVSSNSDNKKQVGSLVDKLNKSSSSQKDEKTLKKQDNDLTIKQEDEIERLSLQSENCIYNKLLTMENDLSSAVIRKLIESNRFESFKGWGVFAMLNRYYYSGINGGVLTKKDYKRVLKFYTDILEQKTRRQVFETGGEKTLSGPAASKILYDALTYYMEGDEDFVTLFKKILNNFKNGGFKHIVLTPSARGALAYVEGNDHKVESNLGRKRGLNGIKEHLQINNNNAIEKQKYLAEIEGRKITTELEKQSVKDLFTKDEETFGSYVLKVNETTIAHKLNILIKSKQEEQEKALKFLFGLDENSAIELQEDEKISEAPYKRFKSVAIAPFLLLTESTIQSAPIKNFDFKTHLKEAVKFFAEKIYDNKNVNTPVFAHVCYFVKKFAAEQDEYFVNMLDKFKAIFNRGDSIISSLSYFIREHRRVLNIMNSKLGETIDIGQTSNKIKAVDAPKIVESATPEIKPKNSWLNLKTKHEIGFGINKNDKNEPKLDESELCEINILLKDNNRTQK